jgi:hypothetical protein
VKTEIESLREALAKAEAERAYTFKLWKAAEGEAAAAQKRIGVLEAALREMRGLFEVHPMGGVTYLWVEPDREASGDRLLATLETARAALSLKAEALTKEKIDALIEEERPKVQAQATQLAMRLRAENTRLREAVLSAVQTIADNVTIARLCRCLGLSYDPPEHLSNCPAVELEALLRRLREASAASDSAAVRQPASEQPAAAPLKEEDR